MALERERIGGHIVYDIPWHEYGYPEVMRAGGTIVIKSKRGRCFKITVEECSD